MIWPAVRVSVQREFFAEQIMRGLFRGRGIDVCVPVRHVVRKQASRNAMRVVRAKPAVPGLMLLGIPEGVDWPTTEIMGFSFVHGFMMGGDGKPIIFTDADVVRIFGNLHQRPHHVRPTGRRRAPGESMQIVDGPYAGRVARVMHEQNEVDFMTLTGTAKWFDDLKIDNALEMA